MKKNIKAIILLMSIIVMLCFISISASAATVTGSCGENVTYKYNTETYELVISGTGDMTNFINSNQTPWSSYQRKIKSVAIEDGVTNVGNFAFGSASSLEKLTIGNSVKSIGSYAFHYCMSLESLTIPDSVIEIKDYAFNASDITSLKIGTGLKAVGSFGFGNLNSLKKVYINSIEQWLEIDFDGMHANPLSSKTTLYVNSLPQTSIVIPEGVTCIKPYAFFDYKNLTSVTLPDTLTQIGTHAFMQTSLTKLNIPSSVKTIDYSAFRAITTLKELTLNEGLQTISESAFYDCDALEVVNIPDSVESIGYSSFAHCNNLKTVNIGKGVTSLKTSAFDKCINLTAINISEENAAYTSIDGAVYTKDKSTLAVFPHGVSECVIYDKATTIADDVFRKSNILTSIKIPLSVTKVGNDAFYDCIFLTKVYYEGSKADWAKITIGNNNAPLRNANIYYAGEPVIATYADNTLTVTTQKFTEGVVIVSYISNDTAHIKIKELNTTWSEQVDESVDTIKIFVWKSTDTMKPLYEMQVLNIN